MRVPSRRMPPARGLSLKGRLLVSIVVLGYLALPLLLLARLWGPWVLLVPAAVVGLFAIRRRRSSRAPEVRDGRSICQFARGFDYRTVDTWIIRAVYEQFSGGRPVRPLDRLWDDLSVDDEERDFGLLFISQRIGRSLEGLERIPVERFQTLHDVVMFFQHQPLTSADQLRE